MMKCEYLRVELRTNLMVMNCEDTMSNPPRRFEPYLLHFLHYFEDDIICICYISTFTNT